MSFLDNYYKGYVNLDHRTDRLQHMRNQLDRIDLKASRHRGILPNQCNGIKGIQTMMNRTPGAVGCHFAQVGIMQHALAVDKNAMVMEDDLIFCEDFNARLPIIDEFLNENDWDVFWLGGTFHVPAFWHKKGRSGMEPSCSAQIGHDCASTDNPRIVKTYGAFCTYAYLVNVNSIEKILALFDEHLHTSIGIDWLFIKLQPQLNCFAFVPGSVKQIDNKSDIGEGDTIFSGFSRLNGTQENSRYWYQERMQDFDPSTFNFDL